MFNGAFTDLLLLALAATLVVAAVIDVRTFTISNRLNLAVALLARRSIGCRLRSSLAGHGDPARRGGNRLRGPRRRFLRRA